MTKVYTHHSLIVAFMVDDKEQEDLHRKKKKVQKLKTIPGHGLAIP